MKEDGCQAERGTEMPRGCPEERCCHASGRHTWAAVEMGTGGKVGQEVGKCEVV